MPKDFTILNVCGGKPSKDVFKSLSDGKYKLEISPFKQRSLRQNAFYWGVVVSMVKDGLNDLGHELSSTETHEFLKARFNSKEVVNEQTGEVIQMPLSTTRLMTVGFMEYIEKIQRFAAEWLSINIPSPNEQMQIDYIENSAA